ncbi:ABC transporter ATP-binding protein [Paenibacillus marinisediminis]
MIELQQVNFLRGERTILNDLNWKTEPGEQWVILGRNGSGKTTLLEIIMGYQFPSSGKVNVLGNQYGRCDVREVRKEIGYIGQSLVEKLTLRDPVWEIVASGIQAYLRLYEVIPEEWKTQAFDNLRLVGLEHLAEQPMSVCSQGERKKILLARALMSNPKLLVMDEPCSGLDLYEREKWLLDLEQLRDRHIHTIYVTHHLEEIVPIFTHVALLEGGRFVAAGRKEEVLTEEHLSHTYGLPVAVDWLDNRPWVRLKST